VSAVADVRRALDAAGLPEAALEARLMVQAADGDPARLAAMLARRLGREPLDRILGRRGFWTLDLALSAGTLSPRADTEAVVGTALALAPRRPGLRLLDLGTGSGAILLALLSEWPDAAGLGTDVSGDALATAARNAASAGLAARARFVRADWTDGLSGPFEVIVSNPPYIPTADIAGLDPEVRLHDPPAALDGGADGLAPYRIILPALPALLAPDGIAVLECGIGQAEDVRAIGEAAGLRHLGTRADLGGIPRAIAFARK
jgi:release factor glutamine methyltransferase